jgi:hypothetical protein
MHGEGHQMYTGALSCPVYPKRVPAPQQHAPITSKGWVSEEYLLPWVSSCSAPLPGFSANCSTTPARRRTSQVCSHAVNLP